MKTTVVRLYVDAASRGNPGPAGVGGLVRGKKGEVVSEWSYYLGETTNNVAEYLAVIYGLQEALMQGFRKVTVCTDSELVSRQLGGEYRVKNETLKWLHALVKHLVKGFVKVEIVKIGREANKEADRLAAKSIKEGREEQARWPLTVNP